MFEQAGGGKTPTTPTVHWQSLPISKKMIKKFITKSSNAKSSKFYFKFASC